MISKGKYEDKINIYQFQSYVNTVDDRQKRRKIGGKGKRKREGQKALKNVIGVWR